MDSLGSIEPASETTEALTTGFFLALRNKSAVSRDKEQKQRKQHARKAALIALVKTCVG